MNINLTKKLFLVSKIIISPFIIYLFFETINLYSGQKYYYILFSIISVGYLYNSLSTKTSFIHLFLSLFLFLGFWFKFSINTFYNTKFTSGNYYAEGTGDFDFSPESLDKVLLVSTLAILSFMLGKSVNLLKIKKNNISNKHKFDNSFIYFIFLIFTIICLINFYYQIYLKGLIGNYIENFLLYNFYAWFYQLGSLIITAYLIDQKLKKNEYFNITLILIIYLSIFSITFNSRNYIFFILPYFTSIYIFSIKNNLKFEGEIRFYILLILSIFLFYISVIFSNIFRSNDFKIFQNDLTSSKIELNSQENVNKTINKKNLINFGNNKRADLSIFQIIKNRFVGIDSLMSVEAKQNKNFDLYLNSFKEEFKLNEITYFEKNFHNTVNLGQFKSDKKHFVVLPGMIGHLYYTGSITYLFISIFIISALITLLENFIRNKYDSICLSSVISYLIVYRIIHFGYVPQQTYKYVLGIILGLVIIFIFNILTRYAKKNFKFNSN